MSYSVQRKNGVELNRCYKEDLPIHDWYRFVLSYPPHLVRDYLRKFDIKKNHFVLDPFCGTGTTLVECKKLGINSVGVEVNPVPNLAAKTKTSWNVVTSELVKHAEKIAKKTSLVLKDNGNTYKKLSDEANKMLINNSISPIPLHQSLILLDAIDESYNEKFVNYEKIAFAKQLVFSFSNLHFGPEVGVSRKLKFDVPVVELWLSQVKKMTNDIENLQYQKDVSSSVHLADSRSINSILEPRSIDAVITSPPYPNEKDYTRITRLESVLLGYIQNKKDLRNYKEKLLRSNTRNIFKGDCDGNWIEGHKGVKILADTIEMKRIELKKTSGFEKLYHKVVRNYFGGMARHLEELKPKLRAGAQLAYVVGDQASYFQIPIRTGQILADIAQNLGYEVIGIDLFRTRLSSVTKEQLREEVVLLRWNR